MPSSSTSMPTIAQLIDRLFRARRHRSGREYSYREVSLAMPGRISHTTLYSLRTGQNMNPTRETLLGLCVFFRVSPTYFFPELDGATVEPLPSDP